MKAALLVGAIVAGMTIAGAPAFAHGDATLNAKKTPNGGQLRQAGPYHYELVVVKDATDTKENAVVVYVTDHDGKKVPTAGASGTATLLAGKLKASAALKPDGENRLKGLAKYAASSDMKVLVAVTLPGKQPEQARFTPLAAAAAEAKVAAAADGHTDHKH